MTDFPANPPHLHVSARKFLDGVMAGPDFPWSDVVPPGRLFKILATKAWEDTDDGFVNLTAGWASEAAFLDDEGFIDLRRATVMGTRSIHRFEARLKERYR